MINDEIGSMAFIRALAIDSYTVPYQGDLNRVF